MTTATLPQGWTLTRKVIEEWHYDPHIDGRSDWVPGVVRGDEPAGGYWWIIYQVVATSAYSVLTVDRQTVFLDKNGRGGFPADKAEAVLDGLEKAVVADIAAAVNTEHFGGEQWSVEF